MTRGVVLTAANATAIVTAVAIAASQMYESHEKTARANLELQIRLYERDRDDTCEIDAIRSSDLYTACVEDLHECREGG